MGDTVLENGVRVLSEHMPGVRSVALGVWVRQGAAHEAPDEMGVSHLLEHMVFKGTRNRNARELAMSLESLGGSLDAYTSREHTSFQARVLDEHLSLAMEVLSDLVVNPLLRERDLKLEREVILEEIATVEDTPDDLVFELHSAGLWDGHPYGHSILGTRETVASFDVTRLAELHRRRYRAGALVVAAAGNVSHDEVVERAREFLGELPDGMPDTAVPEPGEPRIGADWAIRETAQTHIVFGRVTPEHADPRRYPLVLLSQAFGGGMSSRLFQRVREEEALAYTVYAYQSFYSRAGLSGVYVGTRPGWEDRAVEVVREEMARIASEGLPEEELVQTKQQVKGQIMLSLESTSSRMYRLAGSALYDEPFLGLDELLARVDAVTAEEVRETAAEFYDPERQYLLRLGPGS